MALCHSNTDVPALVKEGTEDPPDKLPLPQVETLSIEDVPMLPSIESTSIRLAEYEGEKIEWEDRPTCYLSMNKQCGKVWKRLRIGALQMSLLGKCLGKVPPKMQKSPRECARILCGLSEESFDEASLNRMAMGVKGEPILREWDSKQLGVPIREVGLSVWKKDLRFRGSMDGEINGECFVEYKIPEVMYRNLIEFVEATKKGFTPPPSSHRHIFDSQYIQITGNGVINGKSLCHYVVSSWKDRQVYQQWLPINYEYWEKEIYPLAVAFHEGYVEPLMRQYKFQRIDPDVPMKLYKS